MGYLDQLIYQRRAYCSCDESSGLIEGCFVKRQINNFRLNLLQINLNVPKNEQFAKRNGQTESNTLEKLLEF